MVRVPAVGSDGLGPRFGLEVLTPFYDQAAAISSVDPNTPVFYEPNFVAATGRPFTWARRTIRMASSPTTTTGTPTSWSFENGIFQVGYSTERADGLGSFAAGSQTTMSVPPIQYPSGYQVSVTGGQMVSEPNAPVLVVASDGASSITASVRAAGQ